MVEARVVKGHLIGPSTVELDEPVRIPSGEVEVILRVSGTKATDRADTLAAFLRSLPPGGRTKADIDRQIHDERDSWS